MATLCELCGEPMPEGEQMFKFHGYSGDCPKPPLPRLSKARKHPLRFIAEKGKLADAFGLTPEACKPIEDIVEKHIIDNKNLRQLLEAVGDLEISDELWVNFPYTYGYWDGQRS